MDTLGPNEVLETHLAPFLDQLKCIGTKKHLAGRSLKVVSNEILTPVEDTHLLVVI